MYYKGKTSFLERKISSLNLFFFGLGNILGPQAFILLGGLIKISGVYGILSIFIGAIICLMIATIYSELALSMPIAGIVINSVNDTFGGFISFIVGWSQILGNVTLAAFSALGFGIFIGQPYIGAVLLIFVVTLMEFRGITEVEKFQTILVIVIVSFFLILIGSNAGNVVNISLSFDTSGAFQKIFLGIGFFFLALTGFEDLATYSEEVKNLKHLPKVMISSILVVAGIFMLIYLVLLSDIDMIPLDPLNLLAQNIFGKSAHIAVAVVGISASIGIIMSTLSTISRNIYSMAEVGFLPKPLYKVKNKTPFNAIIAGSLLTLIIVFIGNMEILAYLANFIYFFIAIIVTLALMKLRDKRKQLDRPFKVPFYPLLPIVLLIMLGVLMFFLNVKSIALGFIWLFFGFIIFMFRIVGEHRIKMAVVGGSLIVIFILTFLLLIAQSIYPAANHILVGFAYVSFFVFILYICVYFLLQVLHTKFMHKK